MPTPFKYLLPTVLFALLAGWSVHRDSPQGMLRATGADGCLTVSHGFSSLFLAVIGVAALVAVVIAIASFILGELSIFSARRDGMRRLSRGALIYTVGLAGAALLKFPIESMTPLAPPPANVCKAIA